MKTILNKMNAGGRCAAFVKLVLVCTGVSFTIAAQTALAQKHDKGHDSHVHPPPATSSAKPASSVKLTPLPKLSIPDVAVLDQNGRRQNFYTDLIEDKIVVINFMFTTCKAICPMSGANFSKLQTLLGDRLGQDVFLISVSTDPETDSPEKIKAWGEKFKAKAGWTLVTGEKNEVAELLRALTGDGLNKGYHVRHWSS